MDISVDNPCYLCLSPGTIKCEFCTVDDTSGKNEAFFCSEEHLSLHRDAGILYYDLNYAQCLFTVI